MDEDLTAIRQLFAAHGGTLACWERELLPVWNSFLAANGPRVSSKGHVYAVPPERYRQKNLKISSPDYGKSALTALIQIDRLLKKQNIDFIVVPFPDGYDMAVEQFCTVKSKDNLIKPRDLDFIRQLLEADVETVNLWPELLQEQTKYEKFYDYPDYHPNQYSYMVAVNLLARRLTRYSAVFPSLADKTVPTVSSYLLVGDSFMGGFFPYFEKAMATSADKYYRNGGAFDIFRFLAMNSKGISILTSRPVCIFIFDISHLHAKWSPIPKCFPDQQAGCDQTRTNEFETLTVKSIAKTACRYEVAKSIRMAKSMSHAIQLMIGGEFFRKSLFRCHFRSCRWY